jgi:hypothetical protein
MMRTYLKKEKLLPSLHQTGHLFMLQIVLGMANSTPGNKNNKRNWFKNCGVSRFSK